jgi:hypothetical protein
MTGELPVAPTEGAKPSSPYRRAAVILIIAIALAGLFVTSYIDALGRPTARELSIAVVGRSPEQDPVARALQQAGAKGITFHLYPTQQSAADALRHNGSTRCCCWSPLSGWSWNKVRRPAAPSLGC